MTEQALFATAGVPGSDAAIAGQNAGRILSTVVHDLRAPVRHVQGFVEILTDHLGQSIDEEALGYLQHLQQAAESIQARMAALDRFNNTITSWQAIAPHDGNELASEALLRLSSEIETKAADIEVDVLPVLLCDREALIAVFAELVSNSLKFGQMGVRVEISAELGSPMHTVTVRDDGPGIVSDDPARAFELFRRFHSSDVPGTGTGLAVVEQVVHRHGGVVSMVAGPDAGVDVRLEMPAAL